MLKFLVPTLFVCLLIVGCAATAPPLPPTPIPTLPPAPTGTALPPTVTVEPTAIPTNTTEPTDISAATAVPPASPSQTRKPTPQVSRELLLGTWWQFDNQAQGNNYITFGEDGSFKGRHGPDPQAGIIVTRGTFRLEQDQLTITDDTDCPDGEMYQINFTTTGHLFFKVLGSTCDNFADDFRRQPNWDRLPATP